MAPRKLLLSQIGLLLALNFELFGMVITAYNDDETLTKPVFGNVSLSQKDILT